MLQTAGAGYSVVTAIADGIWQIGNISFHLFILRLLLNKLQLSDIVPF